MAVEFFPLTDAQIEFLNDLYYQKKLVFGRDKLYKFISKNHPEQKITRRQIADYLSNQEVNQLYRNKPTVKSSRPLITSRRTLQIDLIDLITYTGSNNKYSYILNCIDTFSRKMWCYKLISKTNTAVKSFVIPLLKKYEFKVLSSDNGAEFKGFDNELKEIGVKHIFGSPYSPTNQSIVERANGTIKKLIFKMFYIRNNNKWIDLLDELVENYNNTVNRSLKKTPNEVFESSDDEQSELIQKNTERIKKSQKYAEDKKLDIGTLVRIVDVTPKKNKSEKNWSNDIYKVTKIINPRDDTLTRRRYRLQNIDSESILKGNYNITQLQVISKSIAPPARVRSASVNKNIRRRIDQREIDDLNFDGKEIVNKKLRNN